MNTQKTQSGVLALSLLCLVSTSALAGNEPGFKRTQYEDFAQVISATPEYERVNQSQQECSTEYIRDDSYRYEQSNSAPSHTGTIVGGITGALIGSRLGKGNGNRAATAAGAIAGAVIGNQIQTQNRASRCGARPSGGYEPVQRCRVVDHWENRLTGYRVVYEYAGRSYTAVLPYDPGHKLAVRVAVAPAQ